METRNETPRIRLASSERRVVKILILGDFGIGKTTLITTFLDLGYIPEDEENIFEQYRFRMKHNGSEVGVGLYDLSPGQSAFERRQCYPTDVNVILLCFSIGHYESLKSVYNLWVHEARAHFGKLIPIFLVGLRRDLRFVSSFIKVSKIYPNLHVVERSEAGIVHTNYHLHGEYLECSMYDRKTVVDVIEKAFNAAMEHDTTG